MPRYNVYVVTYLSDRQHKRVYNSHTEERALVRARQIAKLLQCKVYVEHDGVIQATFTGVNSNAYHESSTPFRTTLLAGNRQAATRVADSGTNQEGARDSTSSKARWERFIDSYRQGANRRTISAILQG